MDGLLVPSSRAERSSPSKVVIAWALWRSTLLRIGHYQPYSIFSRTYKGNFINHCSIFRFFHNLLTWCYISVSSTAYVGSTHKQNIDCKSCSKFSLSRCPTNDISAINNVRKIRHHGRKTQSFNYDHRGWGRCVWVVHGMVARSCGLQQRTRA